MGRLRDYFDRLYGEGRVDSSGEFTLNSLRALITRVYSSLPDQSFYVLKLIQGLVGSDCNEVDIKLRKNGLRLVFSEERSVDLGSIVKRLLTVDQIDDLVFGIVTAHAAGYIIEWSLSDAERCVLDTQGLTRGLPRVPSSKQRPWLAVRKISTPFWSWKSTMIPERKLIQSRCLSPPVMLNGEGIGRFDAGQTELINGERAVYEAWISRWYIYTCPSENCLPKPYYYPREGIGQNEEFEDQTLLRSKVWYKSFVWSVYKIDGDCISSVKSIEAESAPRFGCKLAIGEPLGPSRIYFIRRGVLVSWEDVELQCPGVVALVSAESLTLDVSGFGLVQSGERSELLRFLDSQIGEMKEQFRRYFDRLTPQLQSKSKWLL